MRWFIIAKMKPYTLHLFFLSVAFIVAIIPAVFTIDKVGGIEKWQDVLPHGVTDSLYYYARIHEVSDGHPLIGNPYAYEYREAFAPAFFLPDVLSAIPLLIGVPFTVTIVGNVLIWSFLFLLFSYKLMRLLGVEKQWAVIWTLFLYLGSYSFMLRPIAMQIMFPVFLLFLVALIQFLYEPFLRRRKIILACVSALAFYFYNYLAFIVFITLGLLFLWFLVARQYKILHSLFVTGVYTTVLLIPYIVYSLIQMQGALYTETLVRIGLVHTHLPSMEAFFFGRWIVIVISAFLVLWYFFPQKDERCVQKKIFIVATGVALFIGLFLNVITGVELTLAVHVGRFVMVWVLIILGVLLHAWYTSTSGKHKGITMCAHAGIGIFVLLLLMMSVRNIPRSLGFFEYDNRGYKIAELQEYAAPLRWLDDVVSEESVVWSNISFGSYVPILTKHYTLFHSGLSLHPIPTSEIEERYFLWRSLQDTTIEDVQRDFDMYAGSGATVDQPRVENDRVRVCNMLSKIIDVSPCPQKTDALALRGNAYFEQLVEQAQNVTLHRKDLLDKYHVEYLVIDTKYDVVNIDIATSSAVYADQRFLIFKVSDVIP